jgi:DNA-binding MarR family transcriptional regulator
MADDDNLRDSDYQALAEFRYQMRRFMRSSEEAARNVGLAPQHHQLMLAVKGSSNGDPRIAYVAERLQIQHHSAVELVDRLARKNLIVRSRGNDDHREVYVQLTSRGERVLDELTRFTRAELRSAAPALVKTLQKITAGAKASKPGARGGHRKPAQRKR